MEFQEAIDIVVARTKHERYRELCSGANPDVGQRDGYRAIVLRMAEEPWPPPPAEYPSLATMAGNLLGAVGRVVAAAATGAPVLVPAEEFDRRLAICRPCDRYDEPAGRCTACGCNVQLKARLASEAGQCPEGKW